MALVLDRVQQSYGGNKIVLDLSLRILPGVTAIMGANGSGKTTLLKTAAGLLPPRRGTVFFNGIPLYPHRAALQIGFVSQEKALPLPLRVRDALLYLGLLYGTGSGKVEILLEEWGLREAASRPLQLLSPGETRRFLIAQSFLRENVIMLLDEATGGLDALYRPLLHRKIMHLRRSGAIVLLATQFYEDVEAVADRLIILKEGRATTPGFPGYRPRS